MGNKPGIIICNTIKGKDIPFAENQPFGITKMFQPRNIIKLLNISIGWRKKLRGKILDALFESMKVDENIFFLTADMGIGLIERFKENFLIDSLM